MKVARAKRARRGPATIEEIRENIRKTARERERSFEDDTEVFTVRTGPSERFLDGLLRLKEAVVNTPVVGRAIRKLYHLARRR